MCRRTASCSTSAADNISFYHPGSTKKIKHAADLSSIGSEIESFPINTRRL